jgi:hypothetical protein
MEACKMFIKLHKMAKLLIPGQFLKSLSYCHCDISIFTRFCDFSSTEAMIIMVNIDRMYTLRRDLTVPHHYLFVRRAVLVLISRKFLATILHLIFAQRWRK